MLVVGAKKVTGTNGTAVGFRKFQRSVKSLLCCEFSIFDFFSSSKIGCFDVTPSTANIEFDVDITLGTCEDLMVRDIPCLSTQNQRWMLVPASFENQNLLLLKTLMQYPLDGCVP
jgi:hypothetical protein